MVLILLAILAVILGSVLGLKSGSNTGSTKGTNNINVFDETRKRFSHDSKVLRSSHEGNQTFFRLKIRVTFFLAKWKVFVDL